MEVEAAKGVDACCNIPGTTDKPGRIEGEEVVMGKAKDVINEFLRCASHLEIKSVRRTERKTAGAEEIGWTVLPAVIRKKQDGRSVGTLKNGGFSPSECIKGSFYKWRRQFSIKTQVHGWPPLRDFIVRPEQKKKISASQFTTLFPEARRLTCPWGEGSKLCIPKDMKE